MSYDFGVAILAAGQGTRLKLNLPKVLSPCVGEVLINFPLNAADQFLALEKMSGLIGVVVGHQRELVSDHLEKYRSKIKSSLKIAVQEVQNGTGGALREYFEQIPHAKDTVYTMVLCGDTPIIGSKDLQELFASLSADPKLNAVAASFIAKNPKGYGRIVRGGSGFRIVEEKDATDDIRKICEVNSGLYIAKTEFVLANLYQIDDKNKSNELYLTDLFKENHHVRPVCFPSEEVFVGVNTLKQLQVVSKTLYQMKCDDLLESGVRLFDSSSTYVDWTVEIGRGSYLYPNVIIEGNSSIGENCCIMANCHLIDTKISNDVTVKSFFSMEGASIQNSAVVGPFARLRPLANIGEGSKVGNFVEIKKSNLGKGVKVSHLSYVGDAEIGENTNIGCGFVSVNYDGVNKHKTSIGKNSFIGSGCNLIAPIKVGDSSFVAAGSTVNKDIPEGSFAIARGRQTNKDGLAKKFLPKKD